MVHGMRDSKVVALKRVPLFSQLTPRELRFVASRTDEVSVPAGRQLTRQGHASDSFYVLLEGEVEVIVDGKKRATLKAGDFFGEISMLDRGVGTATVVTKSPVRMMVMSHAQFRDAIKTSDALLVKVLSAMGARLRADLDAAKEKPRTKAS
jgi:CRP/FNR family transcriptional regulator, cyclic AMP receptor protein